MDEKRARWRLYRTENVMDKEGGIIGKRRRTTTTRGRMRMRRRKGMRTSSIRM